MISKSATVNPPVPIDGSDPSYSVISVYKPSLLVKKIAVLTGSKESLSIVGAIRSRV